MSAAIQFFLGRRSSTVLPFPTSDAILAAAAATAALFFFFDTSAAESSS
jgi:hypothetical protein